MQFGLFGKLQAKRDFIAVQVPRAFLSVFEQWQQSCISTSRMNLGQDWQNAFLTAPIWRFWLGAELCGTTVAGAFMPSMDGVGRYSPLAFVAIADRGDYLPPPDVDSCDDWFSGIETYLLSTLDPAQTFEQTTQALSAFTPPDIPHPNLASDLRWLRDLPVVVGRGSDNFGDLFTHTRRADPMMACASMTYWWTAGGEGYPPTTMASLRMPDPYVFTSMLTGRFSTRIAPGEGET